MNRSRPLEVAAALVPVLAIAGWLLAPMVVGNLGNLYLRDLAMDRADGAVPWVVRELPLVHDTGMGAWLRARASRLLEAKGRLPLALPADTYDRIARAFVEGRIQPHTQMEAELIAWSCFVAGASERCRAALQRQRPEMAAALLDTGIVSAAYVDELNVASGARVGAALGARTIDCRGALEFVRQWVRRDGFRPSQLAASRSLAGSCPEIAEGHFYQARAADVSGLGEEAAAAYRASSPAEHPESAYWFEDFEARAARAGHRQDGRVFESRTFEPEALPARFENGTPMGPDTLAADRDAPGGQARRAAAFGAVLAHGPYVTLPYGRYRVSFFVKGAGTAGSGRMVRVDVRDDAESWRSYTWSRILGAAEPAPTGYQRVDHEFTSTGEGRFSIAVVTLTNKPVAFARVLLQRLGRE